MTAPVVIVGAGPAGMMLAYQLVSNGIPARVIERHKDFDREFRGEVVQSSARVILEQLGVLDELRRSGHVVPIQAIRMRRGSHVFASNVSADGSPVALAIHQPTFLRLMHQQCSRFPGYRLDLGAPVTGLLHHEGRVRGVVARPASGDESIEGSLVVVCNGRASSLRKAAGLTAEELERPYDILSMRFDATHTPALYPDSVEGHLTRKSFYVVYPTHRRRVQFIWWRRRDHAVDMKAPLETLKPEILSDIPAPWHSFFEASMGGHEERQTFRAMCDRLPRWSAPGVLFLGDAAHTMSPLGGQGLNLAIRDAVVAANHLVRAHRAGEPSDEALLLAIEAERRPEIEKMQAFQVRGARVIEAPWAVQVLLTNVVIPLAAKIQGVHYATEVQYGVTDVKMEFPVRSSGAGHLERSSLHIDALDGLR